MLAPALLLVATACGTAPEPSPDIEPAAGAIVRLPFEVDLGGWTSRAEIVHPAPGGPHGDGPWPTVLLLHGNGPQDMDATLPGPDGTVKLFAAIADTLAARGMAVVRYDKRFVKGPGRFDARFWRGQSTLVFTADAQLVLDAARSLPPCDAQRVFLYGWSEGTAVAAALAVQRGDVKGLVLQGPVGLPYREMVRRWIADVGIPYAQGPGGGPITAAKLAEASRGNGGVVAKLGAMLLRDPAGPGVRVSTLLDSDGDGELDPDDEVLPRVPEIVDFCFAENGNCHVYAEGRTVPPVTEQAARLPMPVLILQGEHDASTPPDGARALQQALQAGGNGDVALRLFPGMGHTLGAAASPIDDCGRAPDERLLVDVATWLAARSR